MDNERRGFITVKLTCDTPILATAIAVSNARKEITRVEIPDSGIADSMPVKFTDVAVKLELPQLLAIATSLMHFPSSFRSLMYWFRP